MMRSVFKYSAMAAIIFIVLFSVLYFNSNIGVLESGIEKDARTGHKIDDNWEVTKSTTDNIAAMVFYDENIDNHIFSIYVNRKGLSLGYFFRGAGPVSSDIVQYQIDGYEEKIYLSMNKQQVFKAEIDEGDTIEIIKIDNTKPFALVSHNNIGAIIFYDINNEVVQPFPETL
jgi:hypothetical protein